ncbi:unnamed protein product, partial [Scytosiphon promiscuus]
HQQQHQQHQQKVGATEVRFLRGIMRAAAAAARGCFLFRFAGVLMVRCEAHGSCSPGRLPTTITRGVACEPRKNMSCIFSFFASRPRPVESPRLPSPPAPRLAPSSTACFFVTR